MIVADASVIAEALIRPGESRSIQDRLLDPDEHVHAPYLLDIEVAQVLRRFIRCGDIGADLGEAIISDLMIFPMERHSHDLLLPRIWELRDNLTAYDAAYVALAELLDAPLLTRDARLARAAGHRAKIELV